jgi:ribosomal 30S subunit maturation factor RimM
MWTHRLRIHSITEQKNYMLHNNQNLHKKEHKQLKRMQYIQHIETFNLHTLEHSSTPDRQGARKLRNRLLT